MYHHRQACVSSCLARTLLQKKITLFTHLGKVPGRGWRATYGSQFSLSTLRLGNQSQAGRLGSKCLRQTQQLLELLPYDVFTDDLTINFLKCLHLFVCICAGICERDKESHREESYRHKDRQFRDQKMASVPSSLLLCLLL